MQIDDPADDPDIAAFFDLAEILQSVVLARFGFAIPKIQITCSLGMQFCEGCTPLDTLIDDEDGAQTDPEQEALEDRHEDELQETRLLVGFVTHLVQPRAFAAGTYS